MFTCFVFTPVFPLSCLLRAYIFAKIVPPGASVTEVRYVASCELLAFRGSHMGVNMDDAANNHQLALVRRIQPAVWLKEALAGSISSAGKQSETTKVGRALARLCLGWVKGMHSHGVEPESSPGHQNTLFVSTVAPSHDWKDTQGNGPSQQTDAGTRQRTTCDHLLIPTLCMCMLVLFVWPERASKVDEAEYVIPDPMYICHRAKLNNPPEKKLWTTCVSGHGTGEEGSGTGGGGTPKHLLTRAIVCVLCLIS